METFGTGSGCIGVPVEWIISV